MAQLISPDFGETHQAPVRFPPALPVETQRIVGPDTRTWPWRPSPVRVPSSITSASLEAMGSLVGHGWPVEQLPSSSRAAMPESRSLGPSAHQTGPSPSQTWVGVQLKSSPAGTMLAWSVRRRELSNMLAFISLDRPRPSRQATRAPVPGLGFSDVAGTKSALKLAGQINIAQIV